MNNKPSSYRWVILVINFIFLTFAYAGLSTWAIAVPKLAETFSLTPSQTQLGASMLMAGYAVGSFVESFIAARIGFKKTGLLAAALLLIPQFAIPYTSSYGLILFLRFIQGWGVVWFITTSMTTAWFPLEERGMASGIVSGGIPFGIGVGGVIAGWLLQVLGTWQRSFIYFGFVVLVIVIIWAILARDPQVNPDEGAVSQTANNSLKKVNPFTLAAGWLVAFCLFSNAFQLIGFNTVLPNYMYDLGYGTTQAGTAILLAGLIGVISTPLGGVFSDRLIKKGMEPTKARAYIMAIPGFLIAGIATIAFPFIAQNGYGALLVMAVIACWGVPLTNASIGALPLDMLKDPEIAGKLFGLTILVGISGAVIAPFLITAISTSIGWNAAFGVLGAVALVGVLLGLIIPSFRQKEN
jgi:MFS family permease